MAADAAARLHTPRTTEVTLSLLVLWRGLFGVAALAAAAALLLQPAWFGWPGWLRWLAFAGALTAGLFSLRAALDIPARRHRGRTVSLLIDYLGFIGCALGFMQVTRIFLFTDAMAGALGRSLVALGGVLLGYLVLTVGDRYENAPRTQRQWRRAGEIIMAAAGVLFLIMVGLPAGLLYVGRQLAEPLPLALLLASIVFGLALWAMWRAPSATAMNARTQHEEMLNGWLFLSPNLLGFVIFFAGPLLLSFYFSFTNSDAFNTPQWVGLENYARILNVTIRGLESATQPAAQVLDIKLYDEVWRFTIFGRSYILGAADKLFWLGLRNTLLFAVLAVPLSVIPGLLLANILNSNLPGMTFFRAVYFLPSIAAVVGIALVWQWLYNATIGYINYFVTLSVNGLNGAFGLAIVDPKIQWLSDQRTALLSIVILFAWQRIGFNTVLFLAGLQTIPRTLYEAATVDGAGSWAKLRYVTIPLLSPTTLFVMTTTTILAMQLFEQVFILMNPPEGPNNATVTIVSYLYRSGFQSFRQGYASAISWVLFVMIFAVTLLQFRQQASNDVEG